MLGVNARFSRGGGYGSDGGLVPTKPEKLVYLALLTDIPAAGASGVAEIHPTFP
jgi:hypothetical protein